VTVETTDDPDPSALSVPGHAVEARDGALVVADVAAADLPAVVEAVVDAGLALDAVRWARPDLEEAYFRLTGEAFEGAR
jgi:hypothetical protein